MLRGSRVLALLVVALSAPEPAHAELRLPPGFTAQVYVTGEGFDPNVPRAAPGVPSVATMVFDATGSLYLARPGRRYVSGGEDDLWRMYRVPPGGARLAPATEAGFFHGPPLPNPQVTAVRGGREVFVTTFDRERRIGVLYRMTDSDIDLHAGGTPPAGDRPLLVQPEGVAVDSGGHLYVADREQGVVLQLDPAGKVVDPRLVTVKRPRLVATDGTRLWIGADADATAPWQQGSGEIWKLEPGNRPSLVLRGPLATSFAVGPGGLLFVADRHAAVIFMLTPEGGRLEFLRFTDGDAPRALAFAPVTPDTRRAGIAGDLFISVVPRGVFQLNDVIRVSGPFETLVGANAAHR